VCVCVCVRVCTYGYVCVRVYVCVCARALAVARARVCVCSSIQFVRAVWDVGPTCLVGSGQTIGRGCACAQTHLGRGWLGGAALEGAVTSASLVISEEKTL